MKKWLRKIFFGDVPVSEYSTVTVRGDIKERVYLKVKGASINISSNHWLLCLDPVVFGVWFTNKEHLLLIENNRSCKMYFMDSEKKGKKVAVLKLEFFGKIEEEDGVLFLLKLSKVRIHHLNFIKTRFLFYRHYKKPEQDLFKLKSYSSAYSYPRKVRLISFKEGNYFNIFPMDLVGDVPQSKRYVFGLRHSNVTLARIIETKKIVVSEVPYEQKDIIYQLGKHHRNPHSPATLPFTIMPSETFGFPVPECANSYKEIKIIATLNLGSHMLLWGEEINKKSLTASHGHLFHIHFLHYLHQKNKDLDYPLV